jgi:pimeloyl-ACP methyl ester carboxylesterase
MIGTALSDNGSQIEYEVRGQGTPALVFVHGWSCDRSYWSRQMPEFAQDHQVVAVDLAGHGGSGTRRKSWTMPAFGQDVAAVVTALDLKDIVLIGHSMGGDVIVETALLHPERVRGVVWVDTYRSLGSVGSPEENEAFVASFGTDFVAATQSLVRSMFPADADPALVDWVAADMSAAPPEIAIDALRHSISNDGPILAALRQLTPPVIALNPGYRETDVASLKRYGVEARIVPGAGHFLMMENPLVFNRSLRDAITDLAAGR